MKVDPATHIFVLKDTKIEVKDTTNKIIGRVNEDPTYIKSSLNLWEKICRWTFGLFGNYWEEIPVVVETKTGPEIKAMYIFKKAFPDISLNEKEPIKAEKTQPSRQATPQHVIDAAKRRAAARQEASSLKSKTSKFAQASKVAPAPVEKPVIPKDMLTEGKITEANDFLSLRNLVIDVCKLHDTCEERDLLNALGSKIEEKFKSKDEKFNWEALKTKYESFAVPELDCAISVIEEAMNSKDGQRMRDLLCDILKIPRNADAETLEANILRMESTILSQDAKIKEAPFYYFELLRFSKEDTFKEVEKPKTIPLLNVTKQQIEKAKSSEKKLKLLCKILDLSEDSDIATVRKAARKKLLEIAPDKVQQRSGSQAEYEAATEAFKYFKPLFDSLGK